MSLINPAELCEGVTHVVDHLRQSLGLNNDLFLLQFSGFSYFSSFLMTKKEVMKLIESMLADRSFPSPHLYSCPCSLSYTHRLNSDSSTNQLHLLVIYMNQLSNQTTHFGMWEVSGGNQHDHKENVHIAHRQRCRSGLNWVPGAVKNKVYLLCLSALGVVDRLVSLA